MAKGRKSKTLHDKLKEVDPQFLDNVMALDGGRMGDKIIELAKYQNEIEEARKEDLDLNRILDQKKVAEEVYVQGLKVNKMKIKYLVESLKAKGK